MERRIKDGLSLVLVFCAAIVGESPLWAAGFVAAAGVLQFDKIEALLRRLARRLAQRLARRKPSAQSEYPARCGPSPRRKLPAGPVR